jgi:hypothetical protein
MTLTPSEAAEVLAVAKLVDNRQFDATTAMAWAQLLEPTITLDEALQALARHFATSTDYLMPAHVNQQVAAVRLERKQRIRDAGPPDFPDGLTYAQEQDYRRAYHNLVGNGMSKADAQRQLDTAHNHQRHKLTGPPTEFHKQLEGMFRPVSRRITTWGRWSLRGQDLVLGSNRYRIPLDQLHNLDHWVRKVTELGFGKADLIADLKAAHRDLIGDNAA